ncbi:MAG: DUF3768 domain-containing protein [Rhodomicrobium sp.]
MADHLDEAHQSEAQRTKIRELNDAFRRTLSGGFVVATNGVQALPVEVQLEVVQKIKSFNSFNQDNDPWGEHDFVSIEHAGETFFAKIDYHDLDRRYHSEDPADPAKTCRTMTIMLAEEY